MTDQRRSEFPHIRLLNQVSANEYDWLGCGAYFFQETPEFARHWAKYEREEGTIDDPVIISVDIQYTGFFDLLEHGFATTLRNTYKRLKKQKNALVSG